MNIEHTDGKIGRGFEIFKTQIIPECVELNGGVSSERELEIRDRRVAFVREYPKVAHFVGLIDAATCKQILMNKGTGEA